MEIDQNTTIHVITTTQIIGMSGASVLVGSLVTLFGIYLKSFLESKENKKSRLFEAKRKAYAGLIGQLNNAFAKYDIPVENYNPETILKSLTEYSKNLDYEFSDAILLSDTSVRSKIEEYKRKILSLKSAVLNDANEQILPKTFQDRIAESQKVHDVSKELINMMRKELNIK